MNDSANLRVQSHIDGHASHASGSVFHSDGYRFGYRCRLVQQRRPRHRQTGEILYEGLEVQQCLQSALRDLRLIRRIGGVPPGVQKNSTLDRFGNHRAVVAQADHRRGKFHGGHARLQFV